MSEELPDPVFNDMRVVSVRALQGTGRRSDVTSGLRVYFDDCFTLIVDFLTPAAIPNAESLNANIYALDGTLLGTRTSTFAAVEGSKTKLYCNVTVSEEGAAALNDGLANSGDRFAAAILEVKSADWMYVSQGCEFAASAPEGVPTTQPRELYVLRSTLASIAADVSAMPARNDAQRAARFDALLARLQAL